MISLKVRLLQRQPLRPLSTTMFKASTTPLVKNYLHFMLYQTVQYGEQCQIVEESEQHLDFSLSEFPRNTPLL